MKTKGNYTYLLQEQTSKTISFILVVFLLLASSCKDNVSESNNQKFEGEPQLATEAQNKEKITLEFGSQYDGKRQDKAMQKFRSNRLGQFIHWGLYSLTEGEWDGVEYPGAAEWLPSWANIPNASWDSLIYNFNPTKYKPKEWAALAKQSGFKYVNITTKHHEGFCLWKSDYTDFDIENSSYEGDLIQELVEAYDKEGIDVYFYYSILDWHHPDWRNDLKSREDSIAFERYYQFAKNQLLELQDKFPSVKGFWFDGTWDKSWKNNGEYSYNIEMALKDVNPEIIVNSRLRADDLGSRHYDSNGSLMGDYQSGYERYLPEDNDTTIVKLDWEACMTIPVNQWGYHKNWSLSHLKSSNEIIEMIVKTVSLGGNFLLNFGPKGDGTIRVEEKLIAKELGIWMDKNSKVIYNGDYAGFKHQSWGYYIKNILNNDYYGVIVNKPISNEMRIELPKGKKLLSATLEGKQLNVHRHDKMGYYITLPDIKITSPVVVELKIE